MTIVVNSTNVDELNELSVNLLKSQTAAYILWTILSLVNIVGAVLTLSTIFVWKPLRNDTQWLVANLAVCEIGFSLSIFGASCYHLDNIRTNTSEVQLQPECFAKTAASILFITLLASFHLAISVDRLLAAIFPLFYKNRTRCYVKLVTSVVWLVNVGVLILGISFDLSKEIYVVVCLARAALGETFNKIIILIILTQSLASICVYTLCAIILKSQIYQAKRTNNETTNLSHISKHMKSQATRALALNALIHLLSFTLSSIIVASFSNSVTRSTVAPYMVLLYGLTGISSFAVYYKCQRRFREGLQYLFRRSVIPSSNSVELSRISTQSSEAVD